MAYTNYLYHRGYHDKPVKINKKFHLFKMKVRTSLLLVSLTFASISAFAQPKPNILWVTIEDTSPQFIGCYGNKDASTPNIDKLAKEGIKFSNAFSTGTVCSPSRSTIITGIRTYELGTGHHRSGYPIPSFVHGFPYFLKKQGYYTTNNSKTDYNIRAAKQFIKDAWDDCSQTADWENRKPGQPFFAIYNFMDSHQSRTMTDPYNRYLQEVISELPVADRISENAFSMPPFYNDNLAMRKQFARVYNSIKLTDNKIGALLQRLEKDHLKDSTIIFFYADHGEGIPRGKTNGINLGYRVPFIVWFPPMYQNLSPWGKSGMVTDELVDFEDLAPTLISLAGSDIPSYLKGRILIGDKRAKKVDHLLLSSDRSDNSTDLVRTITDGKYVYSRNFTPYMPQVRYIRYMEVGDIKKQMRKDLAENKLNTLQKSLFDERPAEYLFDIEHDIWETKNLVNDLRLQPLLKKMRKQMDEGVLRSRDIMFLPEYEFGLLSKTTTPYEYRMDDANYPIAEIYSAASLSGKRGKDIAAQQLKLLNSNNNIVRYWAMMGLRSQPAAVLESHKSGVLSAMKDEYPPVSIIAAAIAYDNFRDTTAEDLLKKYITSSNPDLALIAVNFILYVKNKEPFITTVKSLAALKNLNENMKAGCLCFLDSVNQGITAVEVEN